MIATFYNTFYLLSLINKYLGNIKQEYVDYFEHQLCLGQFLYANW